MARFAFFWAPSYQVKESQLMEICHPHNMSRSAPDGEPGFGIRVSLRSSDPFSKLVGDDWEQYHWFETAEERDLVLQDMASQHLYSRQGDAPAMVFEAVER